MTGDCQRGTVPRGVGFGLTCFVLCVLNPQHYDTAHMATSSGSQTILIYYTSFNRVVAPSQQHGVGVPLYWRKKLPGSAVKKEGSRCPD